MERYRDTPPKGEFVLVLEGAPEEEPEEISLEDGVARVLEKRAQGLSMKDAARQVAAETGLSKNELYAAASRK